LIRSQARSSHRSQVIHKASSDCANGTIAH
jgi:hypothetical protein